MKVSKITCGILILLSFNVTPLAAWANQENRNQEKGDEIFTIKPRAQKAIITSKPEAKYPEEAKEWKVTVVVRLRAILSSSGTVSSIRVVKVKAPDGLPTEVTDAFVRAASDAAREIKFEPARKNGEPVSQYIVLEYNIAP